MSSTQFECLLQCGKPCEASSSCDHITKEVWGKLISKYLNWKGCDKFENVYDTVDWDLGPCGKYVHNNCRIDIASSQKLNRSKMRQRKRERESASHDNQTYDSTCEHDQELSLSAPKRLRSNTGTVHDKHLCVWCMKPEDTKHPEQTGKWLLLSCTASWNAFRSHIIVLQDDSMRDRINCLINSTTDPFASAIRYHQKCWLKYVGAYQKMSVEQKLPLLHEVTLHEAQTMFLDHARQVIFDDHEIRTIQGLLRDYKSIVGAYGLPILGVKSSYVKEMLMQEFGAGIGFYVSPQKNQSEAVYDTSGSGSYIEAAISLLGISTEQLLQTVASKVEG